MTKIYIRWVQKIRDERFQREHERRLVRIKLGLLGNVKPVGEGVHEIVFDIGQGYRIYFTQQGEEVIILLCGSSKNDQQRTIRLAINLKRDLE